MLLSFKVFGGIAPRFDPRRLPDTGAQEARDTKVWRANLQPFRSPLNTFLLTNSGNIKTIYRWGQDIPPPAVGDGGNNSDMRYWLAWIVDVDCCKGFIADDAGERTYWTGDGTPKKSDNTRIVSSAPYPSAWWDMRVPAPANKPTVAPAATTRVLALSDSVSVGSSTGSITGAAPTYIGTLRDNLSPELSGLPKLDGNPLSDVILEDRSYVYTYVTGWDEESMPSPPSDVTETDTSVNQTITTDTGPSPNTFNITKKRIYRSSVGASGASAYQLVNEEDLPVATLSYVDNKQQEDLTTVLPSLNWDTPPDDLRGLCAMQNGIMAGFHLNNLCFSEAFYPHAWPEEYRHALDYKIVGIKAFTTYLVVGTEGNPYVFQGSDPSSMSGMKMELKQACVSKRSMVSVGDGVIYASPDGLVMVSPSGVQNLTDSIFTRDDWQAMGPKDIDGYNHEGRYFGFNTVTGKGFCLDPSVPAFYNLTMVACAGFQDLKRDELFFVPDGSHQIVKWEAGTTSYEYAWKSKVFVLPRAANFAVAQVEAQTFPVVFELVVDKQPRHTQNVTSEAPFRLPSGYMGKEVEVRLSGAGIVNAVYVATSVPELAQA